MSPVGELLRVRARKFPSLVNCCSLDWFPNWPKEALIEVANKFIKELEMPDEKIKGALTEMCMLVSVDVTDLCDRYAKELRRKVYTTPKSYLDHIILYGQLLNEKRDEIQSIERKLSFGL
jgi:dynein heavy chain, axonemal